MTSAAQRRPVVVGIGEVLWDVYPDGAHLGGAPANFACHAAALGAEAWIISAVGVDELGDRAAKQLRAQGRNGASRRAQRRRPPFNARSRGYWMSWRRSAC